MKKVVLYLILFSPVQSWAQLHEKFDDNTNKWYLYAEDSAKSVIKSGKYILEITQKKQGRFIMIPVYFDPNKDFSMEVSFAQKSGPDNSWHGLFFGSYNMFNEFVITSNGYYKIGVQGKDSWVKSKTNPMGQSNKLRIQKSGKATSYYLNGQLLLKNESPILGYKAGVINYTKTLEVDYFDLDQNNTIQLIENLPTGLVKENLGPAINTSRDDLSPIISVDGKTLYFGRENYEGNMGGTADGEDIWVSTYDGTQWSQAVNFGAPINDGQVNNLASVSADNNALIFARRSKFDIRKKTETGWSEHEDIGIFYTTESSHEEAQLAADGKAMLVTLKNSNNVYYNKDIDETDIYVSLQDQNGKWSEPLNLGPTLNTFGDETGPFLASDGRTLYFSTNGRPGYGDLDIYVSKRIGDGWTNWSEPLNLGPEINSSGFDAYYTLPASGDYAYLVDDQHSMGKADIFRIKLPQVAKPDPVVLLTGRALNAKNNQPVAAEILLDDLGNGKEVAEANSDPSTGQFKIVLKPGFNYGLHAAAKGYLSVNENMELASIHEYKEMQKDLLLMPIEVGLTLPLNNVFFEQGKPTLRKESYPELDRLVKILVDNPQMQIELAGHTDNVGSGAALMKLSQSRVDIVKKYLENHSVTASRITGKGYGATMPREKNDTEEHRKMNRRVEFKIVSN